MQLCSNDFDWMGQRGNWPITIVIAHVYKRVVDILKGESVYYAYKA